MPKVDALFDDFLQSGGTHLHLGAGHPPLARVDGGLVPLRDENVAADELEDLLGELLSPLQRARFDADLALDFALSHRDAARFRASYFKKQGGAGAVFNLVPLRVRTLAELECPEVLWRLADRRAGLVVVSGPSASGKSTTLAAMIDHINKTRACHILTIEDPIEFVHEPLRAHVTHREIGAHASTVTAAMRNALRENADVILVGELRGAETIKLALRLASQGILVMATMAANGVAATLDRLVNAFTADEQEQVRGMLAENLAAIAAQQLLRAASGKGRVAVHETLLSSEEVAAAVRLREVKPGELDNLMRAGKTQGMQTMELGLAVLVAEGRVSAEDAFDRAMDRERFTQVIARARPPPAESLG